MHLIEGSLLNRGCRRLFLWVVDASRHSLVGRGVKTATLAAGRYGAGSSILGTGRVRSLPLDAADLPVSVAVIARPYLQLRGVLAEGAAGRAYAQVGEWLRSCTFRTGEWMRLVGGALVGVACGRATQGAALTPLILGIAGLLLVLWGPWILMAARRSAVFGALLSVGDSAQPISLNNPPGRKDRLILSVAVAICIVSGAVAGLAGSTGPAWLAVGVLVSIVAVALLWRPEAILLVAAFYPWMDVLARQVLGGLGAAWDEALLLVALLLILWGTLITGRLRLRTVPATLPALCVFVAAVGSMVVRGVPSDVGIDALRLVIQPLLFYFVGFLLVTTGGWLRATVGAFLASTTALALHALTQFEVEVPTLQAWLGSADSKVVIRAFSVMGKPNELGVILVIGMLISVALFLAPRMRRSIRLITGMTAAIHLCAIAVTFSRSSWLGLACGLTALLALAHRKHLLTASGLAVVGIFSMPWLFIGRFSIVFTDYYLVQDAEIGRIFRWRTAIDHIEAHPWFGNGLGTFGGPAAAKYGYWAMWVDNYYLQLAAQGGLLVLAFFLWLLLAVARGLIKSFRIGSDPVARALAAGVFGALIAVCVSSIFLTSFETPGIAAGIWLMAGVATSACLAQSGDSEA